MCPPVVDTGMCCPVLCSLCSALPGVCTASDAAVNKQLVVMPQLGISFVAEHVSPVGGGTLLCRGLSALHGLSQAWLMSKKCLL